MPPRNTLGAETLQAQGAVIDDPLSLRMRTVCELGFGLRV